MSTKKTNFDTLCLHANVDETHLTGAVAMPIYQTATFAHHTLGDGLPYSYSRVSNPSRDNVAKTVAALEGAEHGFALSSGMAATTLIMELFGKGDHIIAGDDLYGGSIRYFNNLAVKHSIEVEYSDTTKLSDIAPRIKVNTKAIFIETPTNPMLKVTDIAEVAKIAKAHGLLLIVDNTFLTPYYQRPLELGADIVLHSGTKYLSGHHDTMCGFVVTNNADLAEKFTFISKILGAGLAPFDCFLVARGIKTLAVRMRAHEENAHKVAAWLRTAPHVKKVYYTGFEDDPGYAVCKKQSSGFGSMISFECDSKETALRVLSGTKMILLAESLGGVESLITYPLTQTHADVPVAKREANGINERLVRLSVGIENAEDIIADLRQALEK